MLDVRQLIRYVANGLTATLVHFAVLTLLVEVAQVPSKGVANTVAALVALGASFTGNRLFVFAATRTPVRGQLARFVLLYASIALVTGALMAIWSDWLGFDYRIGFVLISGVQLVLSYMGNRLLVFRT